MRITLVSVVAIFLSACALPQSTVRTGSAEPSLVVSGATAGSTLYVDGLAMGEAMSFDGRPKVLAILEGPHQLEVRQGSAVIFKERALLSKGEMHQIKLLPKAAAQ